MAIESETEQKFSIDLNSLVADHFCFLKHLHESNVTQNISLKSFEHYQWYWLPSNDLLSPNIAWLRHCHRLAPGKYRTYMNKLFTNKQWEILPSYNRYRYRYQPNLSSFDLRQTLEESQEALDAAKLDGFALLSSAKRQAELYWHLQPYFTAEGVPKFDTEVALKEYHQFLKLMKEHSDQTLVPTYLIDLYWHTHMTGGSVEDYATDCKNICGRFIDHDDEFGDGDRDGVLGEAFEATAKLWEITYGDSTYKEKGGYRGPPPKDYFPNPLSNETAEVETDSKSLEKKAKEVESNDKTKVAENNSPRCGSSFTFPFRNVCVFILTVSFVIGIISFILVMD